MAFDRNAAGGTLENPILSATNKRIPLTRTSLFLVTDARAILARIRPYSKPTISTQLEPLPVGYLPSDLSAPLA